MALVLVITLFSTRVILKSLGTEDYGIYTIVCGFVSLFSFLNSSLSSSINRYLNYALGENDSHRVTAVFNTALLIQIIIAFLLFVLIELVGIWYINEKLVIPLGRLSTAKRIFQFSVLSLVLTLLQAPFLSAVLAYERMSFYAIISILDAVFRLAIAFLIQFSSDDKLYVYGLLMAAISIFNFLAYFLYSRFSFRTIRLRIHFDKFLFRSMLSFSGWSVLNPVAYTARSQGCNVLLNFYGGPLINAAYTIANQVASALDSFSMSISVAFRPQLIQSYSANCFHRTNSLCTMMSKLMYAMILLVSIPLYLDTDYIIHLWLGENVPDYTIRFTSIILLVKLIDSLNPAITNTILATGKIRQYMVWSSIIISSVLPLSFLALKSGLNFDVVFFLMLVLTAINQVVSVFCLIKSFPGFSSNYYLRGVVLPCICYTGLVIPIPIILHLIIKTPLYRILVVSITSIVLSVALGYFFLLHREDRARIKSYFYRGYERQIL